MSQQEYSPLAIVGMAGRFPDAPTLDAFWDNLAAGHESLTEFSDDDLRRAGVDPATAADPNYVKRGTVLEGADLFDAGFFGFTPREAEALDPQHRIFLECAWHALEDAGHLGDRATGSVGVFAGASMNSYIFTNILANRSAQRALGGYQIMLASDKDFLATRVGYKLNLHGPCVTVQTACSTSLVAVQMACQSLLAGQCDIALAGGVSVGFPQRSGYQFSEGMILSRDGHCRPFDADASGTRGGSGAGVVVLRRAADAVRDRDRIRAMVLGAAANNDGARKIGYTAPSVEGQVEAITAAHAAGRVDPASISYVEAHGTATSLGDPIELRALDRVFGGAAARNFCALGSVKSNIGHLDAAAGVAGLIKTVLSLEHQQIPPTLHFKAPNPQIDFGSSAFFVNDRLRDWRPSGEEPRRAAVSSFGIGGTNAHVVLEEAPRPHRPETHRTQQLVTLSARTDSGLGRSADQLADFLRTHPDVELSQVAYTQHVGRRRLARRLSLVAGSRDELLSALEQRTMKAATAARQAEHADVVFLFSGQGSQYPGMAADLLASEPAFAAPFHECTDILRTHLDDDLRDLIGRARGAAGDRTTSRLTQTMFAQPALFAVEYALARMWMSFGVMPTAMMGHSLGEYVAACIAGVFSLEDGLALVAERARLMQQMPAGAMLSVALSPESLSGLGLDVDIAAVNTPQMTVVSGLESKIVSLERLLKSRGIECRTLATSHAFHSAMMDPVIEPLRAAFQRIPLKQPSIPYISNLSGTWIRPEEATSPDYWVKHLRGTVRFADGLATLTTDSSPILLEIGPGETLCGLARNTVRESAAAIAGSLPHRHDPRPDGAAVMQTLGKVWEAGGPVDWSGVHAYDRLGRVPLPLYPFERQSYWIEPEAEAAPARAAARTANVADLFYAPSWIRTPALRNAGRPQPAARRAWLVFANDTELSVAVLDALEARGDSPWIVRAGDALSRDDRYFRIDPSDRAHYDAVIAAVTDAGEGDIAVVHLWNATFGDDPSDEQTGFYGPLYLAQALADSQRQAPATLVFVSSGLQAVLDTDRVEPIKSLALGPIRVVSQELPHVRAIGIDVSDHLDQARAVTIAQQLLLEPDHTRRCRVVAYREGQRWEQTWVAAPIESEDAPLRDEGSYLITGGFGGIGLAIARDMATRLRARLTLVTRRPFPSRAEWERLSVDPAGEDAGRIASVRELEALGARVLVATADAADAAGMQQVILEAERHFGELHGIVHAAGIADGGMIQRKTAAAAARVLAPKVTGTLALDQAIRKGGLDFVVLCSSINAIVGGAGSVDYTAANAFQDAFAQSHADSATRVIAINWDTWGEVGMAVNTVLPADLQAARQARLANGIRTQEGILAFRRALGAGLPQVAVITRNLPELLDEVGRQECAANQATRSGASAEVAASETIAVEPLVAAPDGVSQSQAQVLAIWRELLGVQEIALDDDFFGLGGHSLLATGVLSRVRRAFGVTFTLRTVFEAPTVRQFAALIDEQCPALGGGSADEREEVEL